MNERYLWSLRNELKINVHFDLQIFPLSALQNEFILSENHFIKHKDQIFLAKLYLAAHSVQGG